ncbi:hypothetical protein UY3_08804 [Chelonia mydas]|uniref:Myb/SANT-like DNA-binding domain-containing protein n=1 Tax=Chelonia mydas TaxID=8469 RepID=M7BPX6_CHEMY|nr:hypothetical protein UY3_08804 [Chelonia mydas]
MQSLNRKRAPAWTEWEILDLFAVWGDESVLSELRSKRRNANIFEKISKGMMDRGYNRDPQQFPVKIKELRQAYQKTQELNGCSGDEDFGDEEDEEQEDETAQKASRETVLPDSQELFITLEPIPSQPSQGGLPDHKAREGTSDIVKHTESSNIKGNIFQSSSRVSLYPQKEKEDLAP